jgi:hypothetical protein
VTRSEGIKKLAATGLEHEEIAVRLRAHGLKVTRSAVAHWCRGARKPTDEQRVALKKEWGIPLRSWEIYGAIEEKPNGESKPPRRREAPPEFFAMTTAQTAERLRRNAQQLLFDGEDPDVPAAERRRLLEGAATLLEKVGKLTGESQAITASKVYRSPVWQRIQAAIEKALEPFPQAMRAVGEALAELGQEVET